MEENKVDLNSKNTVNVSQPVSISKNDDVINQLKSSSNDDFDIRRFILIGILIGLIAGLVVFILRRNPVLTMATVLIVTFIISVIGFVFKKNKSSEISDVPIKKPELKSDTLTDKKVDQKVDPNKKTPDKPLLLVDEVKLAKEKQKSKMIKLLLFGILTGLVVAMIYYALNRVIWASLIIFIITPFLFFLYDYFSLQLKKTGRIKRIESVFPDFLQLMSSNLRAGMTIDRAMFLSVRKEFSPLDEEIQKTAKDITTGKSVEVSLAEMAKRIGSQKIEKITLLIISGIRAGGNLATLLEETSVNMREKDFVEQRAASNVLMYVIFIFLTVSVGAPGLFSLSSILVEVLTHLLSSIPQVEGPNMPFTLSAIAIPVSFIRYYCLVFILTTDILACLTLGLVSKGEEREGLKYLIPIVAISLTIFFLIRFFLSGFMSSLFANILPLIF